MKSVTGEIVSSSPVSLSRAASILSNFVSADNGASQAVNTYLRHTISALDELVGLYSKSGHRNHEDRRSDAAEPSQPTTTSVTTIDGAHKRKKNEEEEIEETQRKGEGKVEEEEELSLSNKKMKKTKTSDLCTSGEGQKNKAVEVKGEQSHGGDASFDGSDKQRKKKRKDKSREVENGNVDGYKENGDDREGGNRGVGEEVEKRDDGLKCFKEENNRKKRKNVEIYEERRCNNSQSEERPSKKKR